MFDGRHCTQKDLDLLIRKTKEIIFSISNGDLSKLDVYFSFVARFDKDIEATLSSQIRNAKDNSSIIQIINRNINELKQNVIVDINEH